MLPGRAYWSWCAPIGLLQDIHKPDPTRLRRNLSAVLNFAMFREDQLTVYTQLQASLLLRGMGVVGEPFASELILQYPSLRRSNTRATCAPEKRPRRSTTGCKQSSELWTRANRRRSPRLGV